MSDFRLHRGERFRSVYDYIADWQYNIHLEAILPLDSRRFYKPGRKLKTRCYEQNRFRRYHTDTVDIAKPYGPVRYRFVDAGWLEVSHLKWIWIAMDAKTRQVIAFHIGDRSQHSGEQLWANIPAVYQQQAVFYMGCPPSYTVTRCRKDSTLGRKW